MLVKNFTTYFPNESINEKLSPTNKFIKKRKLFHTNYPNWRSRRFQPRPGRLNFSILLLLNTLPQQQPYRAPGQHTILRQSLRTTTITPTIIEPPSKQSYLIRASLT